MGKELDRLLPKLQEGGRGQGKEEVEYSTLYLHIYSVVVFA